MKYRVHVENKDTRLINGLYKVDPEFKKKELLEMYVDILKVPARYATLKLTHITRTRFSVSLLQFFFYLPTLTLRLAKLTT